MARAPKSTAVYTAYKQAKEAVQTHQALPVPLHLRNAPTGLMKRAGYGAGYVYTPAASEAAAAAQTYLPPELLSTAAAPGAGSGEQRGARGGKDGGARRERFLDDRGLPPSRHRAGAGGAEAAKYAC